MCNDALSAVVCLWHTRANILSVGGPQAIPGNTGDSVASNWTLSWCPAHCDGVVNDICQFHVCGRLEIYNREEKDRYLSPRWMHVYESHWVPSCFTSPVCDGDWGAGSGAVSSSCHSVDCDGVVGIRSQVADGCSSLGAWDGELLGRSSSNWQKMKEDPRLNLESAKGLEDHIKKDMTDLVHRRSCNSLLWQRERPSEWWWWLKWKTLPPGQWEH